MSTGMAPRYSRRSFLKIGAAAAAGLLTLRQPQAQPVGLGISRLNIKSTLPLPGYNFLPFPEQLLERGRQAIDAALVPAYVASQLIQRNMLQPLPGLPGRAHDPDGHYTAPFAYRVAALRFASERTAPKTAGWDELWSAAGGGRWPAFGRVITGAALLRRGYSPNDSHPGHLIQAADDLKRLRPRIALEGTRTETPLAFVLADLAEVGQANGLRLPAPATMLIEYDWVILAGADRAGAAREFINGLRPAAQRLCSDLPVRLIPLMPLAPGAQAQQRDIWGALTGESATWRA